MIIPPSEYVSPMVAMSPEDEGYRGGSGVHADISVDVFRYKGKHWLNNWRAELIDGAITVYAYDSGDYAEMPQVESRLFHVSNIAGDIENYSFAPERTVGDSYGFGGVAPLMMPDFDSSYLAEVDSEVDYNMMQTSMTSAPYDKTIKAYHTGLPDLEAGFLNPKEKFYRTIQQRYHFWRRYIPDVSEPYEEEYLSTGDYFQSTGDPSDGRNPMVHDFEEGGAESFKDYYREEYPDAKYMTIFEEYVFLARWDLFQYFGAPIGTGTGTGLMGVEIGELTSTNNIVALTATNYTHTVMPLPTYGRVWERITAVDSASPMETIDAGTISTDRGFSKYLPRYKPATLTSDTIGGRTGVVLFSLEFDNYGASSGDPGEAVLFDVELARRFGRPSDTREFSSDLIADRIEAITDAIDTADTGTRKVQGIAGVKIQKNSPLSYTLASAMFDDFTMMETPDTSYDEGVTATPFDDRPEATGISAGGSGGGSGTSGY